MEPIVWVLKETVLKIHEQQLLEHGGLSGVRDERLLDSALARPINLSVYAEHQVSIHQLAASYAFGISSNHPFIDGNKRVALVTSFLFLTLNQYKVVATEEESAAIFVSLASNDLTEEDLVFWLRQNSLAV